MKPVQLCELAMHKARNQKYDVVIFDTAGRLAIDNALMQELVDIKTQNKPNNIFFVCDAMIGQSAVQTAKEFDAKLDFTASFLQSWTVMRVVVLHYRSNLSRKTD